MAQQTRRGVMVDLGAAAQAADEAARAEASGTRPKPKTGDYGIKDTAAQIEGAPPRFGEFALPHIFTFQGQQGSIAKVYRASDEALRDSYDNARYMRNDPTVMECIEHRQRSVALLDWHIEPEDETNARECYVRDEITKLLRRMNDFMQYRQALLSAVWYGRAGVAQAWTWADAARQLLHVKKWKPINGDKLCFRYDDGRREYDPDQVGIRVGAGIHMGDRICDRWTVEIANKIDQTDRGLAYFLERSERHLIAIHKHQIEDGDFEAPETAGNIHGVGVRSRIYWMWRMKQETLAFLMEYLERSAFGIEIWYYPWGSEQGKQKVMQAANERIGQGRNTILVPRPLGEEGQAYGVERIEPGMGGVEAVKSIAMDYFGHSIKRLILGQTLTTETGATGMGSGVASVHLDTYLQIVRFDAINLGETITRDLIEPMIALNYPDMIGRAFRFVVETEAPDVDAKLAAWRQAFDMGLKLRARDVADMIGAKTPGVDDEVLQSPAFMQQPTEGDQGDNSAALAGMKSKTAIAMPGDDDFARELWQELQKSKDAGKLRKSLAESEAERKPKAKPPAVEATAENPEDSERQRLATYDRTEGAVEPADDGAAAFVTPIEHYRAAGDRLRGGRADNMNPSDFDPLELQRGALHESEHTDDWLLAREIAMDHLAEDPQYYLKIRKMGRRIPGRRSDGRRKDYAAGSLFDDHDEGDGFKLTNKPAKPKPATFENNRGKQQSMFHGIKDLPGQKNLFGGLDLLSGKDG